MIIRIFLFSILLFAGSVHADQFEFVENFSSKKTSNDQHIFSVNASLNSYSLKLHPTDFARDIKWKNTRTKADIAFYEGHLIGNPNAWARVTITGDRFYGMVQLGNEYLILSNFKQHQPDFSAKNPTRQLPKDYFQSNNDFPFPLENGTEFTHVLPIGIVVDHLYDSKYGGLGTTAALAIVNATDGILRENFGLALRVDSVVLAVDQAFSNAAGATSAQLSEFRRFRVSEPSLDNSGIVYLFTGSPHTDGVIGRAYIGTVCRNELDIGISVDWSRNEAQLMAHELGHNLGSRHDNFLGCAAGLLMDPIINSSRRFSQCSLDIINATIESGSCFLEVTNLSLAARKVDQSAVFQITNENQSNEITETVILTIQTGDTTLRNLPAICNATGEGQVECLIDGLRPGETLDLSFAIDPNSSAVLSGYVEGLLSYEADTTNNSADVNLADRGTVDRSGLCIDPEGDGFGWNGTETCRTNVPAREETEERPDVTNVQTGVPVNFVQAYWNPAEFVAQSIECGPNFWSNEDSSYMENSAFVRRFQHSLADGETSRGTVKVASFALTGEEDEFTGGTTIEEFDWFIEDGRYSGPMPIERSSWIQLVDEGDGRVNATRSWTSDISFDLCHSFPDSSGFFVPSGTINIQVAGTCIDTPPRNDGHGWNGIESCLVDPELDVTGSRSLIVNSVASDIVIDGILDEAAWVNVTQTDTNGNDLRLATTLVGLDLPRSPTWSIGHNTTHLFIAARVPDDSPVNDSAEEFWHDDALELFIDAGYQRNTRYDNDDIQFVFRNTGERTGILNIPATFDFARKYNSDDAEYIYEIQILKSSVSVGTEEFGIELQINDDQDGGLRDSKVGWAGEAGSDTTWYDMSNIGHACFDNGNSTGNCSTGGRTAQCIDTEPLGDGWGWNGTETCRVIVPDVVTNINHCVDTDPIGDGWGWDGTQSCRVDRTTDNPDITTNLCIDTDPIGDGWGWDGTQSCVVDSAPVTCIDTDPVGDGWGWDGVSSCRTATSPTVCVDTDPTGDGWGWDGTASCRI